MTLHISRDIIERSPSDNAMGLYWIALFLRYVLGYTLVGQTNFNTTAVASGTAASINLGPNNEFGVLIPSGQYVLSGADISRLLVLKSSAFPQQNSGIFRIVSVDTNQNIAYIDYSTTTRPPVEISAVTWTVCETETKFSFSTGANAGPGYRSNGIATTSRIILQSPHSSGWQVRLCRESVTDVTNGLPVTTVTPGLGGDSNGDFPVAGQHTHHFLYHNVSNTVYRNTTPGTDKNNANTQSRIYLWGDDVTGSCVFTSRAGGTSADGVRTNWLLFGLCEAETTPLPSLDSYRLFTIGSISAQSPTAITFSTDYGVNFMGGSGFGLGNSPVSACFAIYAKLTGQTVVNTGPKNQATASDNVFTGKTELQTVDVLVGTYDNYDSVLGESVLRLEPRRIGNAPFTRLGRLIGDFVPSADGQWIHLQNGVWMPWGGVIANP